MYVLTNRIILKYSQRARLRAMYHNNIPRMLVILVMSRCYYYYYVLAMFHGITVMTLYGITLYTLSSWHYIRTVIPRITQPCYARLKKIAERPSWLYFHYYLMETLSDWLMTLFIWKRQNNAINSKQNQSRSPLSTCLRKRLNCEFRSHSSRRYSSNDTHI